MAIYTSKFTQQEIDDGIDNANSVVVNVASVATAPPKVNFFILKFLLS